MKRAGLASFGLAGLLAVCVGCAGESLAPDTREPSDVYQPLGRSFFARQSVVANVEGETRRFEIVLESRCGELRLAALTSFGLRLFSAVRNADGLTVDALAGQPLPFEPARVLRDVERSLFASEPVAGDSERVVTFAGEPVHETWREGRLTTRRVRTRDGPDAELVIRYDGALGPTRIAERIELANEAVGYALSIRNHQIEALSCDSD